MSEYLSFYVQRYFMSYLMKQHNYGANTISSYRDTFRLLLAFMAESNTDISKIEIYDISHERVLEFMTWLAEVRKNGVSTKNVRLAHIKSFFRYVMMTAPEHSDQCRKILSIPFGKGEKKPPVCMSTDAIKQLLAAIDSSVDEGLRHLALLSLMYDSACRVQEIIGLNVIDFMANAAGFMSMERETNIALFPYSVKQKRSYQNISNVSALHRMLHCFVIKTGSG